MYEPQHLKRWTLPECYAGEHWPEYYVFLGQHRDSDSLSQSNFTCGLEAIGGETETVQVVREGHWAVGWVEWIAIHQDDEAALERADFIMAGLEEYPVVDEDHWSELEREEAEETWKNSTLRDRMHYLRDTGISLFTIRRDYPPEDDCGTVQQRLNGY